MLSFDEIKHIFGENNYFGDRQSLDRERILSFVASLRDDLILCGKNCSIFLHMLGQLEEDGESYSRVPSSDFDRRWLELIRSHRGVYEQLGFAMLLKMDAEVMMIGMLSAESDTERTVASKHAYTIVAEAWNNDLFNELAGRMKSYPEMLLPKDEYEALWKANKKLVKEMSPDGLSNSIRKAIDAHKASFVKQVDAYSTIDWKQSLIDMLIIVLVVDNIELCLDGVHDRLNAAYDAFDKDTKEYVGRLDALLKEGALF